MSEPRPRWEIILTRQVEQRLYRLPKPLLRRIDQVLLALTENPRPPDSHPVASYDNLYRLPIDEWRIAYAVEDERLVVLILEIAPRQQPERYRLEEESGDALPPERFQQVRTIDPLITYLHLQNSGQFGMKSGTVEDLIHSRGSSLLKRIQRRKTRFLIVDHVPDSREYLEALISLQSDWEVVGIATSGEETIQKAVALHPDLVLMDTSLPDMDGISVCQQIVKQMPAVQVIVMSPSDDYREQAIEAGAKAFLVKPFSAEELLKSIRSVSNKYLRFTSPIAATQEKIRLLIVDDLAETQENLRKLLYFEPDIEIVGAATNGEEAIQMVADRQPDIVLMDIILPGIDGIIATEIISQQVPSTQVIVMSVHGEADFLRRAMLAGAKEFLIKPFSNDELMTSIRRVYRSATLQKRQAAALYFSPGDPFKVLKERLQATLAAEIDRVIDISHPDKIRQIIQDRFEQILTQENIILSRSERERLWEDIVAEILGSINQSSQTTPKKIRLLMLVDNSETLERMRQFLLGEADMEIVGVATNDEAAIQLAKELLPDVVLADMSSVAGVNFLQNPSTPTTMVSVQDGTNYLGHSTTGGGIEYLNKPFSKDELVNSIRRVCPSTRLGQTSLQVRQAAKKQSQLNQEVEGKETELAETRKRTLAQWFKFYKLGPNIEISLSVADLSQSLSFYDKLGLEKVDGGEKPYPWAVVSDGQFHLGLHQREFSSPTLSYFGLGILSERMVHLSSLGVRLNNIQKLEVIQGMQNSELLHRAKFMTAEFESPEGQRVLLADLASDVETTPTGRKFFSRYQQVGELSLKIEDVNTAVAYWEQLGFKQVAGGSHPYPWATISDSLIRLSLHQTPKLTKPAITYVAPNMPEHLKRLRRRGIKFVAERKDKKGRKVGAVVESPDGQLFFLFTGEIKPPMKPIRQEEVHPTVENRPHAERIHWYKIHTDAGSEEKVRQNLLHRVEALGIQDKVFQVVAPGRINERELLPGGQHLAGFILVEMVADEDAWYVVKNTPGVTGFVGSGNRLTPLTPDEVDKILKHLDAKMPDINGNFKVGQKVRIVEGPFEDFMGTVNEVDLDRARVKVQLSFFGQEKLIEFDFVQVERA